MSDEEQRRANVDRFKSLLSEMREKDGSGKPQPKQDPMARLNELKAAYAASPVTLSDAARRLFADNPVPTQEAAE